MILYIVKHDIRRKTSENKPLFIYFFYSCNNYSCNFVLLLLVNKQKMYTNYFLKKISAENALWFLGNIYVDTVN